MSGSEEINAKKWYYNVLCDLEDSKSPVPEEA